MLTSVTIFTQCNVFTACFERWRYCYKRSYAGDRKYEKLVGMMQIWVGIFTFRDNKMNVVAKEPKA